MEGNLSVLSPRADNTVRPQLCSECAVFSESYMPLLPHLLSSPPGTSSIIAASQACRWLGLVMGIQGHNLRTTAGGAMLV